MCKDIDSKNYVCNKFHLNNELECRRKKLLKLRKNKVVFPNDFRRNYFSNQLHKKFGNKSHAELVALDIRVCIAGRIISRRIMGKASFMKLLDDGGDIQLYCYVPGFDPLNISISSPEHHR